MYNAPLNFQSLKKKIQSNFFHYMRSRLFTFCTVWGVGGGVLIVFYNVIWKDDWGFTWWKKLTLRCQKKWLQFESAVATPMVSLILNWPWLHHLRKFCRHLNSFFCGYYFNSLRIDRIVITLKISVALDAFSGKAQRNLTWSDAIFKFRVTI